MLTRRVGLLGVVALAGPWLACASLGPAPAAAATPDPEIAGYVAVEGGRVWYRLNGSRHFAQGEMPLLVIHGGPGFSHHYLLTLTDLAGEYDEATPAACRDFAAKIPDARVEIVEGASHTAHLEQRDAYMAKLRGFLAAIK